MLPKKTQELLDILVIAQPYKKNISCTTDLDVTKTHIILLKSILKTKFNENDNILIGVAWNIEFWSDQKAYDNTYTIKILTNIYDEGSNQAEVALSDLYEYYVDDFKSGRVSIKGLDIIIRSPIFHDDEDREKRKKLDALLKEVYNYSDIYLFIEKNSKNIIKDITKWNLWIKTLNIVYKKLFIFEKTRLIGVLDKNEYLTIKIFNEENIKTIDIYYE